MDYHDAHRNTHRACDKCGHFYSCESCPRCEPRTDVDDSVPRDLGRNPIKHKSRSRAAAVAAGIGCAGLILLLTVYYSWYLPKGIGSSGALDSDGDSETGPRSESPLPKLLPEVPMDVTKGDGWNTIYRAYPIGAEHVKPDSRLVGKQIDTVRLTLSKQGTITGIAMVGVFDDQGNLKFQFGTQDVSLLSSTNARDYFYSTKRAYTIASDDRVGIRYEGGDSNNWLRVHQSNTDQFDEASSVLGWWISSTGSWADGGGDGGDLRLCLAFRAGCAETTDQLRLPIQSWEHCSSAISGYGTMFDDIQTDCYTYWSVLEHGTYLKSFRFKLPPQLVGLKSIAASSAVYQYGPNDFELALYDDIGEKRYQVQLWELPQ